MTWPCLSLHPVLLAHPHPSHRAFLTCLLIMNMMYYRSAYVRSPSEDPTSNSSAGEQDQAKSASNATAEKKIHGEESHQLDEASVNVCRSSH